MTPRFTAQRKRALGMRYDTSLVLRRGATTLAAQSVAIHIPPRVARERLTESGEAAQADVEVWGSVALDIQRGDRFTWDGTLCEVTFVRPGREAATIAEAVALR